MAFGGVLEVEVFGGFQHRAAHLGDEVALLVVGEVFVDDGGGDGMASKDSLSCIVSRFIELETWVCSIGSEHLLLETL